MPSLARVAAVCERQQPAVQTTKTPAQARQRPQRASPSRAVAAAHCGYCPARTTPGVYSLLRSVPANAARVKRRRQLEVCRALASAAPHLIFFRPAPCPPRPPAARRLPAAMPRCRLLPAVAVHTIALRRLCDCY